MALDPIEELVEFDRENVAVAKADLLAANQI